MVQKEPVLPHRKELGIGSKRQRRQAGRKVGKGRGKKGRMHRQGEREAEKRSWKYDKAILNPRKCFYQERLLMVL